MTLFHMALGALGRAASRLVTYLAHFAVSRFFVDNDFCRSGIAMARGIFTAAIDKFTVGFVVESDRPFFAAFGIGNDVSRQRKRRSERDQYQSQNQFLHAFLPIK
jgi:hypothetical protein